MLNLSTLDTGKGYSDFTQVFVYRWATLIRLRLHRVEINMFVFLNGTTYVLLLEEIVCMYE